MKGRKNSGNIEGFAEEAKVQNCYHGPRCFQLTVVLFQVDAKYLRNMRFSRKHNKSTAQQKKTFEKRKVEGRPDKRPSLH